MPKRRLVHVYLLIVHAYSLEEDLFQRGDVRAPAADAQTTVFVLQVVKQLLEPDATT